MTIVLGIQTNSHLPLTADSQIIWIIQERKGGKKPKNDQEDVEIKNPNYTNKINKMPSNIFPLDYCAYKSKTENKLYLEVNIMQVFL